MLHAYCTHAGTNDVHPVSVSHQSSSKGQGELPPWVDLRDLHSIRGLPNVVFAADGSGEFSRIMDALELQSELSGEIFGYQDNQYSYSQQQFYTNCKIRGSMNFIFGHASAAFQYCIILVKKGLSTQNNTITSQDRTSSSLASAFSFQFCNISADLDLLPFVGSISTYLGRPWKQYSRVGGMQSYMSDVLSLEGWLECNSSLYLDTLYCVEYNNYGSGARLDRRVKWQGFHVINDFRPAWKFTVFELIMEEQWLPSTRVPFIPGLRD
ncbi:probable pectinesterase/pectinesterase inhibitor 32 [Lotus japonicus]|uniref:probable pectinesterase/pectinesterase inhibitor 32 n=1 Tax=Lotus japonicus TaxID=34305 RepID=UPI00258B1E30|nr:probable pectinesterase/pectinesterase inhibitor 32 [Lotus japonicus]